MIAGFRAQRDVGRRFSKREAVVIRTTGIEPTMRRFVGMVA